MMGQVNSGTASFRAGGSVIDRGSMLNVGNISIQAGGNIGAPGSAINLNVNTIGNISGNNIYLSQSRGGPLMVNTINAQGRLELSVPNGQIKDGNDVQGQPNLNITAASALFDAEQIGERSNPLELKIPERLPCKIPRGNRLNRVISGRICRTARTGRLTQFTTSAYRDW